MSKTKLAKALGTVHFKDADGVQQVKYHTDKPFKVPEKAFDELVALGAIRAARKSDLDDDHELEAEVELPPPPKEAVVVGNQGEGDVLQVQGTAPAPDSAPKTTSTADNGETAQVAIPDDWQKSHWQTRVKLAEAISGKEVVAQGDTTAADVANGIISAELSRRANVPTGANTTTTAGGDNAAGDLLG